MAQRIDFSAQTNVGNVADPVNLQDVVTLAYFNTHGVGSLSTVSVNSLNGFAGGAVTTGNNAAITLSTSVNGIIKGNGTSLLAAVAGTDYQAPITLTTTGTSGAATFINNVLNIPNYVGGGGAGLTLQVNGEVVPPTAGVINFVDDAEPSNRVVISNSVSNQIYWTVDPTSEISVPLLTLSANSTPRVSIGASASTNAYTLIMPLAQGGNGQVLTNNGSGNLSWTTPATGGGITGINIQSFNGFAGNVSVTNNVAAITLSTSVSGLLKANGSSLLAATAGTDYQDPITLTTNGTSGAATFVNGTLNIPNYATGGGGSGTVTNVSTSIAAFNITNPTTTPVLAVTGGTSGEFLRQDGQWATPSGGTGGYPTLTEPSWRTVTGSGTQAISITDNSQPAINFFAGLNFLQIQFSYGTVSVNTFTATTAGALDWVSSGILGLKAAVRYDFVAGANFANAVIGLLNAAISDPIRWKIAGGSFDPQFQNISMAYTGTISPFSGASITLGSSNSWNGNASGPETTSINYVAQVSGAPQFRQITPDDILPAISGTPTDGQVVSWNAAGNTSRWENPSGGGVSNVSFSTPASNAFSVTNPGSTPTIGFQNVGATPANVFLRGDGTWAAAGVVGSFSGSAVWASGGASKNAYNADGSVNTQGITLTVTLTTGPIGSQFTSCLIGLNGMYATGTYSSGMSALIFTFTIPASALTGNTGETAANVNMQLSGQFNGQPIVLNNIATLTNIQSIPFATTLTAVYSPAVLPFYTTQSNINYSYINTSGTITSFAGTITLTTGGTLAASAVSGSFADQPLLGGTVGGTATGTGLQGAGSSTVSLSGTLDPATIYTPAFYTQTANSTPPTFTTASTQTNRAAQGATITYPLATATTQYDWIATQRPLANIFIVTPFGNAPLVPDAPVTTQIISGQTFTVYGFTRLSTSVAVQLVIS